MKSYISHFIFYKLKSKWKISMRSQNWLLIFWFYQNHNSVIQKKIIKNVARFILRATNTRSNSILARSLHCQKLRKTQNKIIKKLHRIIAYNDNNSEFITQSPYMIVSWIKQSWWENSSCIKKSNFQYPSKDL